VPPPLEYLPFNYTFSKTSGYFPGDLDVREHSASAGPNGNGAQMGAGFGPSNLILLRAFEILPKLDYVFELKLISI
jgi:hypothetical protein